MLLYLVPAAVIALLAVVYWIVAYCCARNPHLRRWFLVGGAGALCLAGSLVPWVFAKLKPPFSDSPSGVLVILSKILVVGSLGLGGVGALLGAALPARRRDSDH